MGGSLYIAKIQFSNQSLFCNYRERNFNANFLVKTNDSSVFTKSLNRGLDRNDLVVNFYALLRKFFCNLSVGNRTVDRTIFACLNSERERNAVEFFSLSLSVSLNLFEFLSLLLQVFSEDLLCRWSSQNSLTLRDKEVKTITILNVNNVILVTKIVDVF